MDHVSIAKKAPSEFLDFAHGKTPKHLAPSEKPEQPPPLKEDATESEQASYKTKLKDWSDKKTSFDEAKAKREDLDKQWKAAVAPFGSDEIIAAFQGMQVHVADHEQHSATIQSKLKHANERLAEYSNMDDKFQDERLALETRKGRYKIAFILLAVATSIAIPIVAFWMNHKLSKLEPKAALNNN